MAKNFRIIFNFFPHPIRSPVLVFTLKFDAWKLRTVVAFRAIRFHHANTHFVKNLFTFWAFASQMHTFLVRSAIEFAFFAHC